jgi:hypothetical protein
MRRAAKRDIAEPLIVETFRKAGCTVERMDQPCDLLVGVHGVTHLVEVKTCSKGYGKGLNGNQEAFARQWRGGPVRVVRTPEDALSLVNEWRGVALLTADREDSA